MNFIVSTLWARIVGPGKTEEFLVNSTACAETEEEALGSAVKSVQKALTSNPAMLKQSMVTPIQIVDGKIFIALKPDEKSSDFDRQKNLGII